MTVLTRLIPGKKLLRFSALLIVIGFSWYLIRPKLRPSAPIPDKRVFERAQQVRILRDNTGVPHIFGKTDADTAFGLAYAHAEDDYPIIQGSVAAARGQLSLLMLNKIGLINDYLVRFLYLPEKVDRQYEQLISPEFKRLLDAYADGLNLYAYRHPDQVDTRLLPFRGKDVIAGFVHKLALFIGVGAVLEDLMSKDKTRIKVGQPIQRVLTRNDRLPSWYRSEIMGSNAHAVGPGRSADGITRLNINSHQPFEGPVAWYEAHLVSEEGWNMIGGLFPGSPVILHGHNQHLGWAHTVNRPDGVDIYKLTMHPDHSMRYQLDGQWQALEVTKTTIDVDIGLFTMPVHRDLYRSVHGPVMKLDSGFYAIRYAGKDRSGLSVEQWYRMNRASNLEEWKKAMAMQGIPMMNTMFADRENILYVYNHLLPIRDESFNWLTILPGDTSKAIWQSYLPFEKLPMVQNPAAGYIMNTNSTPYLTTSGAGNPDPASYSSTLGIETRMNNRALRSHELFGGDPSITREEFLEYKFDRKYSAASIVFQDIVYPLTSRYQPQNADEAKALQILKDWNGEANEESTGASLVNLIYRAIWKAQFSQQAGVAVPAVETEFQNAVAFLKEHFKRVDVPLGTLQRLRRGTTDLPLSGSIDTLNAVHTKIEDGHLVGTAGDSYILVVEFSDQGARSWSRHQYGNVNRPDSKHYADQAQAFTRHVLKESLLTEEAVRRDLESEYHPGEEP
ncbi:acylase [bacterium]|nr:acylase [bacterium]